MNRVDALVRLLSDILKHRDEEMKFDWRFSCNMSHIELATSCMLDLRYFNFVFVNIRGGQKDALKLFRHWYSFRAVNKRNTHFALDYEAIVVKIMYEGSG